MSQHPSSGDQPDGALVAPAGDASPGSAPELTAPSSGSESDGPSGPEATPTPAPSEATAPPAGPESSPSEASAAPLAPELAPEAPVPDAAAEAAAPAVETAPAAEEPAPESVRLPESFDELDLPDALRRAIARIGWSKPTPVQALSFQPLHQGHDVLVQSHTGSGKTGAFCIPWLAARFDPRPAPQTGVQLLVLLPTRELAKQVCDELRRLAVEAPVEVLPIYGGTPMQPQLAALKAGVHAVVGTPGRVLDHIRRRSLDLSKVTTVVLDECDEMLSMGFLEDIRAILDACTGKHLTALFSATIPGDIQRIAKRYMKSPIEIQLSGDMVAAAEIEHAYYIVSGALKTRDLLDVISVEEPARAIIFCNTREETKLVASVLRREGYHAEELSSDLTQAAREKVMGLMREHKLRFLVATDVAARGIDITHVSHVINYSFPESAEVYIHRTGRTGRAGRTGTAISLIHARELGNFYYLKLQYDTIVFRERFLPSADQLATQRMEIKLDAISKRFPELVSPEWVLLARNLMADPRGERVIGLLLERAMKQPPPQPHLEDGERPAVEGAAGEAAEARPELPRGEGRPDEPREDRERREFAPRPSGGEYGRPEYRERRERRDGRDGRDSRDSRGRRDERPDRRERGERDERRDRRPGERDDRFGRRRDEDRGRPRRDDERPRRDDERPRRDDERPRRDDERPRREHADARRPAPEPVAAIAPAVAAEPALPPVPAPIGDLVQSTGEAGVPVEAQPTEGRWIPIDRRGRRGDRGRFVRWPQAAPGTSAATPEAAALEAGVPSEPAPVPTDLVETPGEATTLAAAPIAALEDTEARRKRRRKRRRRRGPGDEVVAGVEAATGPEEEADEEGAEVEAAPVEAAASEPQADQGLAPGGRKRRRKRRGRLGSEAPRAPVAPVAAAPEPVAPPPPAPRRPSQDEIVIDIDEAELEVVTTEFGELDDIDEFALLDRRQAVIETLQEEVEIEDVSRRDAIAAEAEAETEEEDETEAETEVEAEAEAASETSAAAGAAETEAEARKRKRRRRRKKASPAAPPELTAPPHKDFWEVWSSKFSFKDFEDSQVGPPPELEPAPTPAPVVVAPAVAAAPPAPARPPRAQPAPTPRPAPSATADADDGEFTKVQLNLGRVHGHKSSSIRNLLRSHLGLEGRAIRDLTVRDVSTLFRVHESEVERCQAILAAASVDGIGLALDRAENSREELRAPLPEDFEEAPRGEPTEIRLDPLEFESVMPMVEEPGS